MDIGVLAADDCALSKVARERRLDVAAGMRALEQGLRSVPRSTRTPQVDPVWSWIGLRWPFFQHKSQAGDNSGRARPGCACSCFPQSASVAINHQGQRRSATVLRPDWPDRGGPPRRRDGGTSREDRRSRTGSLVLNGRLGVAVRYKVILLPSRRVTSTDFLSAEGKDDAWTGVKHGRSRCDARMPLAFSVVGSSGCEPMNPM